MKRAATIIRTARTFVTLRAHIKRTAALCKVDRQTAADAYVLFLEARKPDGTYRFTPDQAVDYVDRLAVNVAKEGGDLATAAAGLLYAAVHVQEQGSSDARR